MLTGWRLTVSKCFIIPQRYLLAIMGFLAILNAYTMRVSLSIAITEMVIPKNTTGVSADDTCTYPEEEQSKPVIANQKDLFEWNEEQQGLILSAFFIGYVLTHLPGGLMAEKYGGKYTLGIGLLLSAILTLLTPVVTRTGDWIWLCVLRVFIGLGQGVVFPTLNAILAKWVPLSERAKLGTITFTGPLLGTVVSNSVGGVVIEATQDWASVFYLFGTMGILWVILWTLLCYSDPQSHPFISNKEKAFLEKELPKISKDELDVPWKAILTSIPVWALVIVQMGQDWCFFVISTNLPKYMKDVLKFSVTANGLWSSLPYVVMWFTSIGCGWLCDWLIKEKYLGISCARKSFTAFTATVPVIFMVGASYAGCDRMLTVALFTIAMGARGTFFAGIKVNALDLTLKYAGTLMAIVNGIGAITGIITPYLIGALTPDSTLSQWRLVFWITFAVSVGSGIVFVIFASADEQWWNTPGATKPILWNQTKKQSKQ